MGKYAFTLGQGYFTLIFRVTKKIIVNLVIKQINDNGGKNMSIILLELEWVDCKRYKTFSKVKSVASCDEVPNCIPFAEDRG